MTQFEQENDFGRGGGEVDDETMDDAWDAAEERLGGDADEGDDEDDEDDAPEAA
jgi:hypothetical protein